METIPVYKGKNKNILVISGGGTKGLSALGSITALIENEIILFPEIFCGTSVGAVISFLINIGYSPKDIYNVLDTFDFSNFIEYLDPEDIIFDNEFAFCDIKFLTDLLKEFMRLKNIPRNITFKQLFEKTQSKLIITGTCVNDYNIEYFSVDNYPDMEIFKAVRISISIPFLFKPYKYDNKLWVDGGVMNNYPIEIFKDKLDDVIGINLDDSYEYSEINDPKDYFISVLKCAYRGLDFNKIKIYEDNTINLIHETRNSSWGLSKSYKKKLFDYGYNFTIDYIKNKFNY